jgi:GAF domain-containing protein
MTNELPNDTSVSSEITPAPDADAAFATTTSRDAPEAAGAGIAYGTLANASLPGAAFHPHEFHVELSQTSLAEADELLKSTLDESMHAIGGTRAFLALVDTLSGELVLRFTAGDGWTDDIRRLRVNMRAVKEEQSKNKGEGSRNQASTLATSLGMHPQDNRQGITRHVVVNGRRYWTGDVSKDPYYIGFFDDVKSEVAVPIMARGGGTIGVVNVESPEPDAFDEEHANVLSVLARRIASSLPWPSINCARKRSLPLAAIFNSTADVEIVMEEWWCRRPKSCAPTIAHCFSWTKKATVCNWRPATGRSANRPVAAVRAMHWARGSPAWVAQHGETIRVGDPRTDPRWKGLFMEAPAGELAAVMAVPVRGHRGMIGVLRVVRHRKGSLVFSAARVYAGR